MVLAVSGIAIDFSITREMDPCELEEHLVTLLSLIRGDLVVLPEACISGFIPNEEWIYAHNRSPNSGHRLTMRQVAKRSSKFILYGTFGRNSGSNLNMGILVSPDGDEIAHYAKEKLFTPGGEGNLSHGGENSLFVEIADYKVSVKICYDLRYPEIFYRDPADIDLFIILAQWPSTRENALKKLAFARAIENEANVVIVNSFSNRIDDIQYPGTCMAINPIGDEIEGHECPLPYKNFTWELSHKTSFAILGSKTQRN